MTSHPDWESLVARLQADLHARESQDPFRDNEAWKIVARILQARSYVLIAHSVLKQQDISDVVQNVLLKLQSTHTMRRLVAARNPEGYVFVMLRNATRDLARRRELESALFSSLDEEGSEEPTSAPSQALQTEEVSIVKKALEILSEEEKEWLRMRFWKEMSIAEIAAEKGMNYSAAALKLFRILHRLRDHTEPP